jgi:long-chain acyl-CoA synthetase
MPGQVQTIPIESTDSIADCFARRVALTPGAIAYRRFDTAKEAWVDITWQEAAAAVARVRSGFARETLQPGERVAVMLRNGPEWIYFDQAAHAEGLVVVPLYVDDRPDNIAYILENSGCRVLLVEGEEHLKKLARFATACRPCSASYASRVVLPRTSA